MKKTRIKLSLVKLNAIRYVTRERGFIIVPLNEITTKMKNYIVKMFRGETALKRAGLQIDVYPLELENEIYIIAEARRITAEPTKQEEIQAIIKPETTTKEAEKQ